MAAARRERGLHPRRSGARRWPRRSPGCWAARCGTTRLGPPPPPGARTRSLPPSTASTENWTGLLENAPSLVIMQHSARISSIRKRISALNMLLKSIQRRIDNMDRIISTGLTSDHSSPVKSQSLK